MSESIMSCKNVVWKIGAYVDGELPEVEREEVESHLASCSDCAETAEEFRRLDEAAGQSRVPAVSGEEWARLWEGVQAGMRQAPAGRVIPFPHIGGFRSWLLPVASAAAVLAICAFLGGWWLGHSPDSVGTVEPKIAPPGNMDTFAELRAGSKPEISVDTAGDEDMTILDYKSF